MKNVSELAVGILNFHYGSVFSIYVSEMTMLKQQANLMVDEYWLRLASFHCCTTLLCVW
jgi:hypothetical protein